MPNRALHLRVAAIAIGAALQLALAGPARAASDPSAGEIFDRALAFARAQNYPPYVSFIVTVRTQAKGRWLVEQFQSRCRARDDRVATDAKPISSTNPPDNPYKFTLKVKGLALHDSPNIDEPFGVPEISPIYDFGLSKLPPATSAERAYDIALLDVETFRSRRTYLLELTPLLDPKVYRLRELWVDAKTFEIVKLMSDGAFRSGQATTVAWIVTYTVNRGRWLIDSESTSAALLLGGYAPAVDPYVPLPFATRYDGVSYSFTNFDFPKSSTDMLFIESRSSEAIQM
jgi:hypothetical protein